MSSALARHNTLINGTIEHHSGHVFKTVGDGFCAVFASPRDAVLSAVDIQLALAAQQWPGGIDIRVRSALHTGWVEFRDRDYFGPPVNHVARYVAAGHGGQILLSSATAQLAKDDLPHGVTLRDLGEHRLKDLRETQHIWQVVHPHLPADFPPLRSMRTQETNLPVQLTSFVGRRQEKADVADLIDGSRLVTLTGGGGCGKTRLALHVAAGLVEAFTDGVWLVELAALSDPALVPQAVATVLGVRETTGRPILDSLKEHVHSRDMLLVLDNCEHILQACALLTEDLLHSCPGLRVLATSREALGLNGEATFRVGTLSSPDLTRLPKAAEMDSYDAVRLFVERSHLTAPNFRLTDRNALAVAQVCHRLDGIPLAIELAAARIRAMPVESLARRLEDGFRILTGGKRSELPHHQTLGALIEWSYDLLTDQERAMLRQLSVFAGGWTLDAAEAVCLPMVEELEHVELLTSLVDKSLVTYDDEAGRYHLLTTVRQYAYERLSDSGELPGCRVRHLNWFAALAEQAEHELTGPDQVSWLNQLESDLDNFRSAIAFSCEESAGDDKALGMGAALWRFWLMRGYVSEGRSLIDRALAVDRPPKRDLSRTRMLNAAGNLAYVQSDVEAAEKHYDDCLSISREIDNKKGVATALSNLANLVYLRGDLRSARSLEEEAIAIYRELGSSLGVATALGNLANILQDLGSAELSASLHSESLAMHRELGNEQGIGLALMNLGNLACSNNELSRARALLEESLQIQDRLGYRYGMAYALCYLGNVATGESEFDSARALFDESIKMGRESADQTVLATAHHGLAGCLWEQGDLAGALVLEQRCLATYRSVGDRIGVLRSLEACSLLACMSRSGAARACDGKALRSTVAQLSAAQAIRGEIGAAMTPLETRRLEAGTQAARAALGPASFSEAWSSGQALTLDQAVELAVQAQSGDS